MAAPLTNERLFDLRFDRNRARLEVVAKGTGDPFSYCCKPSASRIAAPLVPACSGTGDPGGADARWRPTEVDVVDKLRALGRGLKQDRRGTRPEIYPTGDIQR